MDGAVRSGERAADEVLHGLRFGTPGTKPKPKKKAKPKHQRRPTTSPGFTG